MYARVFDLGIIDLYNVKSLPELPLNALSPWSPKKDNDFSTFKISDIKNQNDIKWIVLRALADRFNDRKNGFVLYFLDDNFLITNKLNVCDDNQKNLNVLHADIKDINFNTFCKIVCYTFEHKQENINYKTIDMNDIKMYLDSLSVDELDKFIKYHTDKSSEKPNSFRNKINNTYNRV